MQRTRKLFVCFTATIHRPLIRGEIPVGPSPANSRSLITAVHVDRRRGHAKPGRVPDARSVACLPACLPCLLACLPACLPACLRACLRGVRLSSVSSSANAGWPRQLAGASNDTQRRRAVLLPPPAPLPLSFLSPSLRNYSVPTRTTPLPRVIPRRRSRRARRMVPSPSAPAPDPYRLPSPLLPFLTARGAARRGTCSMASRPAIRSSFSLSLVVSPSSFSLDPYELVSLALLAPSLSFAASQSINPCYCLSFH